MSHEIRTPMNGVVGMVDLLKRTRMEEDQLQMLETIQNSSTSLLRIIDDILDFSKIEAGKMSLSLEQVDLWNVVENVVETVAPTAQKSGVRLELNLDFDMPHHASTDAGRLRQVLLNLVGNAVKFTAQKKGGAAPQVELSAGVTPDGQVEFRVIDNGIGIAAEAQERLFQPFYQAYETDSRLISGTGLGLAISHDLVKMMGGRISVESAPEQGATFTVTLPLIDQQRAAESPDMTIEGLEDYTLVVRMGDEICRSQLIRFANAWREQIRVFEDDARLIDWVSGQHRIPLVLMSMTGEEQRRDFIERMLETEPEAKFLGLTDDPAMRLGRHDAHLYLIRHAPLLPSRIRTGVAALLTETPQRPVEQKPQKPLRRGSILLVEDNRINQEVLMRQLALLGYGAEAAENGQEGLRIWKEGAFDLILTDCQMPVMDGLEMVRQIRNAEGAGKRPPTPIVGISANALKGEAERCIAAGMDGFLTKPAKLDELRDCLDRWTGYQGAA